MNKALVAIIAVLILMTSPAYAGSVVDIARSQLGKGEIGGDNRGKEVKEYTHGQEVAWCSAFVSWVRSRAGLYGSYYLRARSYWDLNPDKHVSTPQPGDVIVFTRGGQKGHVGIVEKVEGKIITTIEGNVGPYPAKVKRFTYTLGKIPNLIGFVRL